MIAEHAETERRTLLESEKREPAKRAAKNERRALLMLLKTCACGRHCGDDKKTLEC